MGFGGIMYYIWWIYEEISNFFCEVMSIIYDMIHGDNGTKWLDI